MNDIDLRRVDLNLLVVFEALIAERHVGRAAKRLKVGQPAVSHALARLRRVFEDPLFVRNPKGVEPTGRTLALAPQISDLLDRARAVFAAEPRFDPARPHRFTIGQTDGSIPVLINLVEHLRASAPKVRLDVRRVDADGVVQAIDRQELDLAFAAIPSERRIARIIRDPALHVHYVGLARRGHPLFRTSRSAEEFAALPHVAISPRAESSYTDRLFAEVGIRRNVVLTIPHFLAAPLIVARTDLVTVIDAAIARLYMSDTRLAVFKLPKELRTIAVDMLSARARRDEAALGWLREQCLAVARKLAGRVHSDKRRIETYARGGKPSSTPARPARAGS